MLEIIFVRPVSECVCVCVHAHVCACVRDKSPFIAYKSMGSGSLQL